MTDTRLTLCLPVDLIRFFDAQQTQASIRTDVIAGSADDEDVLASYIEDAEDELFELTGGEFETARVGSPGLPESYEAVTFNVSGHKQYRRAFSHATFDYAYDEKTVHLDNGDILPFDSAAGDEVLVYEGVSEGYEDITDEEGETWRIVDNRAGVLAIDPELIFDARIGRPRDGVSLGNDRLRDLRFRISYRYGGLGGTRREAATAELDTSLSDSQTGTVAVTTDSAFPSGNDAGSIVVLIGREYLEVLPDPANDQVEILTRGVRGTTAAAHDDGDRIQYTPPAVRKAVAARASMQLLQSSRYQSFLPDSEDAIDKGDMMDESQAVWERTVEALM